LCCQSQSRRTLEVVDDAVIVLPVAHRSLSIFARWHSTVSIVARGSLEASVERVKTHVDEMPHDDDLMTQELE
jgi:hypothetical protein